MILTFAFLLLFAEEAPESLDQSLKRFVQVFAAVQENAAEPVNSAQAMYEGAIPGMLKRLDPHSIFFNPAHFEQLRELEKSTRKGFGSIVSLLPGRVIVLQTLPGTPSAKSGLGPGDEIIAINGIPLARLEVEQLVQLLTESRQQQVRLDVRRPGNARILPLMLTPEEVDSASVDRAFLLRPGIGYVRASSFDANTGKQVREAIEKLGGASLKGFVLDLRDNSGGILAAAVETCTLFLEPGKKIVSIKGRAAGGDEAVVPKEAVPYTFPMAVLINGKSASASEIVAGALEDHNRAVILGEQSFGKGLVQSVFPLSEGAGLALTTAFYYTPGGRSIQRPLPGQLERTTQGAGGGLLPRHVVQPEAMTRFRAVLEANGVFTSYASDWLQRTRTTVPEDFEVSNELMDEFQSAMSARNVRPSLAEWSAEREWIRSRLKQEILNLARGVSTGDQVELQRDPVVRAALSSIGAQ